MLERDIQTVVEKTKKRRSRICSRNKDKKGKGSGKKMLVIIR